ncbi:chondroitin proteoglycan-2 [Plakobranchus ocellatus]|uniref:Chondroitin proteoglycan-2 n=1 Tax=Plakobranchus ocellatus TaxID=259542 RepID=A0AAV4ACB9_9GAST|nr:chondroitin proteoglycan-2 [Plakobranchus ocellatus]
MAGRRGARRLFDCLCSPCVSLVCNKREWCSSRAGGAVRSTGRQFDCLCSPCVSLVCNKRDWYKALARKMMLLPSVLSLLLILLSWSGDCEAAHIKHSSRVRRQAYNTAFCPQPNGQFQYASDCTRYVQCDQGRASIETCTPNLVFNPARGYCDFPANVPFCRPPQGQITGSPSQSINFDICSSAPNGGDPVNGYEVPHPQICNAFYTCSNNYLYAPCTFCPEYTYFSLPERRCRENSTGDFNSVCSGREYVPHSQKVYRQLDGTCSPFSGYQGPISDRQNYGRGVAPPGGTYVGGVYYPAGAIYPGTYVPGTYPQGAYAPVYLGKLERGIFKCHKAELLF